MGVSVDGNGVSVGETAVGCSSALTTVGDGATVGGGMGVSVGASTTTVAGFSLRGVKVGLGVRVPTTTAAVRSAVADLACCWGMITNAHNKPPTPMTKAKMATTRLPRPLPGLLLPLSVDM